MLVFGFFLVDERARSSDPAGFVTAVPTWAVGETISSASERSAASLEIRTELLSAMLDAWFNGIFVVERA